MLTIIAFSLPSVKPAGTATQPVTGHQYRKDIDRPAGIMLYSWFRSDTMNREHVLLVASDVENSKTYDHRLFWHTNGTPGCLAGHAAVRAKGTGHISYVADDIAKRYMQLTEPQSHFLFYGGFEASNRKAAATLRHLAATNVVDWNSFTRAFRTAWRAVRHAFGGAVSRP